MSTGRERLERAAERWEIVLGEEHPAWGHAIGALIAGARGVVDDADAELNAPTEEWPRGMRRPAKRGGGNGAGNRPAAPRGGDTAALAAELDGCLGRLREALSSEPRSAQELAGLVGHRVPVVSRVLRMLVRSRVAQQHGTRRGARYTLAAPAAAEVAP